MTDVRSVLDHASQNGCKSRVFRKVSEGQIIPLSERPDRALSIDTLDYARTLVQGNQVALNRVYGRFRHSVPQLVDALYDSVSHKERNVAVVGLSHLVRIGLNASPVLAVSFQIAAQHAGIESYLVTGEMAPEGSQFGGAPVAYNIVNRNGWKLLDLENQIAGKKVVADVTGINYELKMVHTQQGTGRIYRL